MSTTLRSKEEILTALFGVRLDSPGTIPLDKKECLMAMEEYANQLQQPALREVLRKYAAAQSRMLQKWADGDAAVKNQLWRDLHSLEDGARALLEELPSVHKKDEPEASNPDLDSVASHSSGVGNSIGQGIEMIAAERKRQVEVEDWDIFHDEDYHGGELVAAAACYATNAINKYYEFEKCRFQVRPVKNIAGADFVGDWKDGWPWDAQWDKRKKHDKLRSLVIAGALIAAEIDRLSQLNKQP